MPAIGLAIVAFTFLYVLPRVADYGAVWRTVRSLTPEQLALLGAATAANVITYALVFWELDNGGPIARALAESRDRPDFQFPQDENGELAPPGWAPALVDYLYLSLTNSVAFSPTDAMPLTHSAKLFMGLEASISLVTVLVVAARAINVLGS